MLRSATYRTILTAGLLFTAGIYTFAQQPALDSLKIKFNRYRQKGFQEKIYVHIDRPGYLTGETMWFKIYLTDGVFHKPSALSDVAYIEVLDQAAQPVLQTKVSLNEGNGNGSLFIPATLNSGNYVIRAYTSWMKNFSADYFFHKSISVVNAFKKLEHESAAPTAALDAQFFPEGGTLVGGVKSKIGFRVTNASGKGIAFAGALINQQNDTVARFNPLKFGIGSFTFTPQPGHIYRAVVREASGKASTVKFPAVVSTGYSMRVTDSVENTLHINVHSTVQTEEPNFVYAFIHARQVIAIAEAKYIKNGVATFTVSKQDLPEGINQITIFDGNLKPLCERLYFKKPESTFSINLKTDQTQYSNRRRVRVDLQASRGTSGKTSDLSIAVYKVDSIFTEAGSSITDYFSLTSDLKGTIESPEYYRSNDAAVKEATDNLMLTHGWRRFQWDDVVASKYPAINFLPEYRGHIVKGMVRNADGSIARGILTYAAAPGKITRLYGSRSNDKGEVYYEMQKSSGSANIVLQTNPTRDSTHRIEILSPFASDFASIAIPPLHLSSSHAQALLDRSVALQVQDVYYRDQFEKLASREADSSAFYGPPDEKYILDAFTRFPVMEEVMREYVPGVMVRKRKDGFHFMVIDHVHKDVFNDTPLIMLDGVPIFDEDEIMAFNPLRVRKLEVVTKRYYLGPLSFPGIVSYTTYQGDLGGFQLNPKSVKMNYEGLQLQREFYLPRYESQQQRQSRMPDQRTLLYWNPSAVTNADGTLQLEFYTSDQSGNFRIVVEGMTADGLTGSNAAGFTVNPHNN
ncbi:hypothetical protein ACFQ21_10540 [Ohtaekwangia kribbensis]|uniref:MG2 domain-containing protein n=1 Tax=Ohtaekwangia kribbensis TaxID=688913 RepID=A0ABW3K0W8_9BACT